MTFQTHQMNGQEQLVTNMYQEAKIVASMVMNKLHKFNLSHKLKEYNASKYFIMHMYIASCKSEGTLLLCKSEWFLNDNITWNWSKWYILPIYKNPHYPSLLLYVHVHLHYELWKITLRKLLYMVVKVAVLHLINPKFVRTTLTCMQEFENIKTTQVGNDNELNNNFHMSFIIL